MTVQFAVLASGSRGNSTLIRSGGAGLLVDLGIGPRSLEQRLQSVGAALDQVAAAVLTHTHGDHVDPHSLNALARHGVAFYCHEGHRRELARHEGYQKLEAAGRVRTYDDRPFLAPTGLRVEPVALRHDGPTFGFRFEAKPSARRGTVALGYMADTGSWTDAMVEPMIDVDVLGLEFNHDVDLQRRSGRHPALIARNLGDHGHLSNAQAAGFVSAVLARSARGTVRHLVMLHLSAQCNRPELAVRTARAAVKGTGRRTVVHAAQQDPAHPNLWVEPSRRRGAVHA